MKVTGILLAAGSSKRFGADKLMQPLATGDTVCETSAGLLKRFCADLIIVASPFSGAGELLARRGYRVTMNRNAACGMSSSIIAGVRASAEADGWLILPADMPFIRSESIAAVVTGFTGQRSITAPCHDGRRGHPVLFSRHFFDELVELEGDIGAREILRANNDIVECIPVADAGVLQDIDTPADLPAGWHQ